MIVLVAAILLEAGHKDAPIAVIIPLAIIIPLAVLVIGALIRPRGGGH